MFDTIEVLSPELTELNVLDIKNKSILMQRIDAETGELLHQIITSKLQGSYDASLSIRVVQGNKVRISGSVHKYILGHNCWGGPNDIKECCRYLINLASKRLGVDLPSWDKWELMRADIAHVFNLSDKETVLDYFRMMRGCTYPRRKPLNFGLSGLYFPGKSTTLKFYAKGEEFKKHDKVRLKNLQNKGYFKDDNIELMQKLADCLLRVELEVRKRKMKYDKIDNRCINLKNEYFEQLYVIEVTKVLEEGKSYMEIVRTNKQVKERLYEYYTKREANTLFSFWSRIQVEGEDLVKKELSKATWYRNKKKLNDISISLQGIILINSNIPKLKESRANNFVPLPGEQYHISGEFIDVTEALKIYEIA